MSGVFQRKQKVYTGTITRMSETLVEFTSTNGEVHTFDITPRNFKKLASWIGFYPNAQNPRPNTKLSVQENEVIGWE